MGINPEAPVAKGGPASLDRGNRRDWFPGLGERVDPLSRMSATNPEIGGRTKIEEPDQRRSDAFRYSRTIEPGDSSISILKVFNAEPFIVTGADGS
jgi:hypothetical protein